MKAFDTATSGFHPSTAADPGADAARLGADEVTSWLLEGRFFTIDPAGAVTTWSPVAADAFGWRRQDIVGQLFVDTLLAPPERPAHKEALTRLLKGDAGAGFSGDLDALDAAENTLRASVAVVPIQLDAGYEFNALLQQLAARPHAADTAADQKARHESVLSLVEAALGGGGQVAGALVVFRTGAAAPGEPAQPVADNVVSISDAAGLEEARAQLERARRDAEEGRVEIRSLEGQLEEARREAQRSRTEVDVARQESADARDALVVAQREAEEARRQLDESRRSADEVRAAAEGARIRSEDAQREADSLRAQLREARESVRGMAGRADDELAEVKEQAALAARTLADAQADAARHRAEVAPLRERYQATQRELGALRADLESAQAAAAERDTLSERRAGELERARAELDEVRSRMEDRMAEAASKLEARSAEVAALRAVLDERPETSVVQIEEARVEEVALEDDHFRLHCQPVLDLRTNEVTQYELLIRMIAEDGRLLMPEAFLGPARRAGLAHSIDRWVIRKAIRVLRETDDVSLEVNLSPEAVHDPELAALIDEELTLTSVDPGRLVLEVSGDTASEHLEETRALAKRLRGLGCRFALDAFRSSVGSFRLLRELPLDYLKLDGELVESLAESRTSQLIVKALVDVASGTGMKTVAVFVSDEETLALLRQQGVDYAQGYTVGRPRAIEDAFGGQAQLPPG